MCFSSGATCSNKLSFRSEATSSHFPSQKRDIGRIFHASRVRYHLKAFVRSRHHARPTPAPIAFRRVSEYNYADMQNCHPYQNGLFFAIKMEKFRHSIGCLSKGGPKCDICPTSQPFLAGSKHDRHLMTAFYATLWSQINIV